MYKILFSLCAVFVFNSCGYHLGGLKPQSMSKVESISVDVFVNDSLEPQASGLVTNSLSEALQRDGTFKLKSRKSADARVEGRIASISYIQLRSSDQDTYRSTEIGLNMIVEYKVIDTNTNRVLTSGSTNNQASLFNLGNSQTSKTNALSYAARLAGQAIADSLTNG